MSSSPFRPYALKLNTTARRAGRSRDFIGSKEHTIAMVTNAGLFHGTFLPMQNTIAGFQGHI
jgi:hypothetical protein